MLSNRNIIEAAKSSSEFDHLKQDDEVLAYLPMAWVGDFIFSIGQAYWKGFCVNCPESAETLLTDLREIAPSYYFAPPRIFETQLTQIMIRMEDAGAFKQRMFKYFMEHARKVGPAILDGKSVGVMDRLKYAVGRVHGVWAIEERDGLFPGAGGLHGGARRSGRKSLISIALWGST